VRYHTCWGSWHAPHTTDIPFEHVIDLLKIRPAPTPSDGGRAATDYKVCRTTNYDGKIFIPGVIAHKTTTIETPELVADRLVMWANMFSRESHCRRRLGVGGRCVRTWAGLLKALVDGAALASSALEIANARIRLPGILVGVGAVSSATRQVASGSASSIASSSLRGWT
jgi:5-methyltetrahydropteroyltriglutamate--homocysteine methyltransferase